MAEQVSESAACWIVGNDVITEPNGRTFKKN